MNIIKLQEIGLNKNEAIVYLTLLKIGKSSASQISKYCELHRAVVYDNLERLISKGLISSIKEKESSSFFLNPPDTLSNFLEKQKQDIMKKLECADKLKNTIKSQNLHSYNQEVRVLRGKKGIRILYDEILNFNQYYAFGAPKKSVELMGEPFWKNIDVKTKENDIQINLIFNNSLNEFGKKVSKKYKNIKIKFLDQEFESLTQTIIYGEKVAIIVWSDKPITTIISDKNVYDSYKSYFKVLWKMAK